MLPRSIVFALLIVLWTSEVAAQVSYDQIVHASENRDNWATYSGDIGSVNFILSPISFYSTANTPAGIRLYRP